MMRKFKSCLRATACLLLAALWLEPQASAQAGQLTAHQQLAREIFQELIEINTTDSAGNTTAAAEAVAARLKAAGFAAADVQVIGPDPRKRNLVARLRGTGSRRPILLLAHLDVVEARREDWSIDPFKFIERDGYFYGRGTSDIKDGASILVANMIRLKQEGFKSDRDIILALTADEEGGEFNGVEWLVQHHRDLIDAEFCINTDGGDFQMKDRKRVLSAVQASEKVPVYFFFEVKNKGGHSSLPVKENAIYRLAEGLARLSKYDFPVSLNEVTRAFFERKAAIESGQTSADMKAVAAARPDPAAVERLSASPYYNALMRTTCVATKLEAGHAPNALPQMARATVNCRMLPGQSPQEVEQTLVRVVSDDQIAVRLAGASSPSPASPLRPEILQPIERAVASMWPGVPVVPVMETGATDGITLRNAGIPTYGVSGVFIDMDDVRAHGKDERVGVREFYEGLEFHYRLLKSLAAAR
jgi:acetylornithine deacetylase/succinyl-diaminopimelate desuccinylase-like protein